MRFVPPPLFVGQCANGRKHRQPRDDAEPGAAGAAARRFRPRPRLCASPAGGRCARCRGALYRRGRPAAICRAMAMRPAIWNGCMPRRPNMAAPGRRRPSGAGAGTGRGRARRLYARLPLQSHAGGKLAGAGRIAGRRRARRRGRCRPRPGHAHCRPATRTGRGRSSSSRRPAAARRGNCAAISAQAPARAMSRACACWPKSAAAWACSTMPNSCWKARSRSSRTMCSCGSTTSRCCASGRNSQRARAEAAALYSRDPHNPRVSVAARHREHADRRLRPRASTVRCGAEKRAAAIRQR